MIHAGPQFILFDPTPLIFIGMIVLIWPIMLFVGVKLVQNYSYLARIAVFLGVLILVGSPTLLFVNLYYIADFEPERRAKLLQQGFVYELLIPSPIYLPLLLAPLAVRRGDPSTPSEE